MQRQPLAASQRDRIAAGLPFVEALARRMAASMPHSIDIGDLVQDGVLGLIDAAHRFDEARGIKFETFAERRVRGAMIDALRKDAWPRGVRRQRRELEAAREAAAPRARRTSRRWRTSPPRVGSDEKRLEPHDRPHQHDRIDLAARHRRARRRERRCRRRSCRPSPSAPDTRVRAARSRATACAPRSQSLPPREHKVIGLYYYGEVTMKQIGAEIGVNESRVSQLHARAIRRLREALGADVPPAEAADGAASGDPVVPADDAADADGEGEHAGDAGVVLPYARRKTVARASGAATQARPDRRRALVAATRASRGRRAAGPQAGTASRASGSRSPRGSARRRCRRRRR